MGILLAVSQSESDCLRFQWQLSAEYSETMSAVMCTCSCIGRSDGLGPRRRAGRGGSWGGRGGMGGGPPPPIEGVREDLPYIQCGTCKALVRRAFYVAKTARAELKKRAPTEEEYMAKLEGICDTDLPSGEWIHSYDLVENGRAVSLKKMTQAGECTVECKTVALACASTMAEAETDLAEAFYSNAKTSKELEALKARLCEQFFVSTDTFHMSRFLTDPHGQRRAPVAFAR